MQVHATAGLVVIRLGHERGVHFMVVGHVLDQTLQQSGVVAGLHGVIHVVQVDLKLPGRGLGYQRIRWQLLLMGGIQHVRQEFCVFVQIINGIGLRARRAFAREG